MPFTADAGCAIATAVENADRAEGSADGKGWTR